MQNVFNKNRRFEPEVLLRSDSVQACIAAEQAWLDEHFGKSGCANLSPRASGGVGSPKGRLISEATRAKIAQTLKGHPLSEETRAKISQALKGRPVSSEVARKGAETRRGQKRKPYSAEALNNIRQAARLRAERAKGKA